MSTDPNRLNTDQDMNPERRLHTKPNGNPDEKVAIQSFSEKIQRDARLKLRLEDLIVNNPRFATLFSGLKLNAEHNSAVIEPLLFLTRRLVYAIAIVYMQHSPQVMTAIMMSMSLIVLVFTVYERPWKEAEMNFLAVVNEAFLYSLLVLVLVAINIQEGTGK